jgi:Polysaccharide biosynthesis protein
MSLRWRRLRRLDDPKLADRSLGLISTIIFAWLLVPTDFRLVALIVMLELLGSFGFDMALIQNPSNARTAWTFNVLFSLTRGVWCWFY